MLNMIKNIIKEKKAYQESAEIIMEDDKLDDSIILGDTEEVKGGEEVPAADPEEPEEKPEEKPAEDPDPTIEQPPVENPEPAPADTSGILSTDIDLLTNTSTDTLPVPPVSASDTVDTDDILNTSIDSGFGDEPTEPVKSDTSSEEDILSASIDDTATSAPADDNAPAEEDILKTDIDATTEETPKEESAITEAISIEGGEESTPAEGGEEAPAEGSEGEEPNAVTSAINDKIEDVATPAEEPTGTEGETVNGNEALMKKLSNLTKTIEDIKMNVIGKE